MSSPLRCLLRRAAVAAAVGALAVLALSSLALAMVVGGLTAAAVALDMYVGHAQRRAAQRAEAALAARRADPASTPEAFTVDWTRRS